MNEWVERLLDIRHTVSDTRYGYPFILIRPDLHLPAKFGFDSRARLTPDRISSISGVLCWVGDIITDRVNIGRRQQAAGAAGNLGYQADFMVHDRYSNPIFGRKSTSNHHYIPLSFSGILSTKYAWLWLRIENTGAELFRCIPTLLGMKSTIQNMWYTIRYPIWFICYLWAVTCKYYYYYYLTFLALW